MGKVWQFLKKLKYWICNPTIPLLGIYPKEMKRSILNNCIHLSVYRNKVQNSQKQEIAQMLINGWMHRQKPVTRGHILYYSINIFCGIQNIFYIYQRSRISKSRESESRWMAFRDFVGRKEWGITVWCDIFPFWVKNSFETQ